MHITGLMSSAIAYHWMEAGEISLGRYALNMHYATYENSPADHEPDSIGFCLLYTPAGKSQMVEGWSHAIPIKPFPHFLSTVQKTMMALKASYNQHEPASLSACMCFLLLVACLPFSPELLEQLFLSCCEASGEGNAKVHNLVPSPPWQPLQLLADPFAAYPQCVIVLCSCLHHHVYWSVNSLHPASHESK